jgi:hypothetical protein
MNSKLVSNLDHLNMEGSSDGLQRGENGHIELSWSKDIRERIMQFFYQLVRTKEHKHLENVYIKLILDVFISDITESEMREYIGVLYKMIAYTRDIDNGKGEYQLAYMMIASWAKLQYVIKYENEYTQYVIQAIDRTDIKFKNIEYLYSKKFYDLTNELAYFAIENFLSTENGHPIGSYKDIKYFIDYWRSIWCNIYKESKYMNAEIITKLIDFANTQLKKDIDSMCQSSQKDISLVSKWIPREKSKYGWMTKYFAKQYFANEKWFETPVVIAQQISAEKKALTIYRKLLSQANRHIDTVQIKQCSGNWKEIDFDKGVTSITMSKQKHAFMNIKKNKTARYPDNEDRVECARNYREYLGSCKEGKTQIKGKCVSIYDFVKDAASINPYISINDEENTQDIIDTINLQWKDNSNINSSFNNLIAMVDTSGSMTSDNNIPLYNAIGLGIRIAERSTLGKRVLTFSEKPEWFNLDDCPEFFSCVKKIQNAPWGMNTNFYAALDKILQAYVTMNLHPQQVEKYGLIILSDMQIDHAVNYLPGETMNTMFEEIQRRFAFIGLNSPYKTPYKVPFIVFWNLRKTNGFPTTSSTKNVAMISGYSPALLNQFLNRGLEAFKDYNPWDIMVSSMEHQRYEKYGINALELVNNMFTHDIVIQTTTTVPTPTTTPTSSSTTATTVSESIQTEESVWICNECEGENSHYDYVCDTCGLMEKPFDA